MDKEEAFKAIDEQREQLCALSDAIWDFAETGYHETKSSRAVQDYLGERGFDISAHLTGISTAFKASFGSGRPKIGILGEFDALSGMDQQPESDEALGGKKIPAAAHGCGHNLLGVGSVAAALAIKRYLVASGTPGSVVYYGCPAEEEGSGKTFLARDGAFSDLDCALSWHPDDRNSAVVRPNLANAKYLYRFTGKSAHAAISPHLGRSALDAVELMNVGANYLREHVIPEARFHYAVTNSGGDAPNVVQQRAEVVYLIRAPFVEQVNEIVERIHDVAQGAALMTGTILEIDFIKACSNLVPNWTLQRAIHQNFLDLTEEIFSIDDIRYAERIRRSIDDCEIADDAIASKIEPFKKVAGISPSSSDVGDVSQLCPVGLADIATWVPGTQYHSWQAVVQGKSSIAHQELLRAGKVLAGTAIDLFKSQALLKKAKREFMKGINKKKYQCPIPANAMPRIDRYETPLDAP
jgi:aminobenzoyl-glutamate utilization protein B